MQESDKTPLWRYCYHVGLVIGRSRVCSPLKQNINRCISGCKLCGLISLTSHTAIFNCMVQGKDICIIIVKKS